LQQGVEILHSTLLHEFWHVIQIFETCNISEQSAGTCTDRNDLEEMDAYLSQIEAGYPSKGDQAFLGESLCELGLFFPKSAEIIPVPEGRS